MTKAASIVVGGLLALTACGGVGDPAEVTVEPVAYVRSVCRAMLQWNSDINDAFGVVDDKPDTDVSATIRRDMLEFFDTVQKKTETMRTRVEEAGSPDVPDGAGLARELGNALRTAADKLDANRKAFAAIPITDVQPAASIEGALTVFAEQFDAVHASVERLGERSPDLRQAQEAEPACVEFMEQR